MLPEHLSDIPKLKPASEITYESPKPSDVVRGTAIQMEMFFSNRLQDTGHFTGFLLGDTLDLLIRTQAGFVRNIPTVDKLGLISPDRLDEILRVTKPFLNNPEEENEAFGVALVSFSFMPELATHSSLPQGFSRRGMLAPPCTTGEYMGRISELKSQVIKIVSGEIKPEDMTRKVDPSLWRTYLFFQVGSAIPLKMPESPTEARQKINNLLQGIEIDL